MSQEQEQTPPPDEKAEKPKDYIAEHHAKEAARAKANPNPLKKTARTDWRTSR